VGLEAVPLVQSPTLLRLSAKGAPDLHCRAYATESPGSSERQKWLLEYGSMKHQSAYKNVVERLHAMTFLLLRDWRFHPPNFPHGEDPSVDDTHWQLIKVKPGLTESGGSSVDSPPGWYRTVIVIPPAIGGKDIHGARVRISLLVLPNVIKGYPAMRVFFDGINVAVTRGGQRPSAILMAQHAVPGTAIPIAVHVLQNGSQGFRFFGGQLLIDFGDKPDPGVLRDQILSIETLIASLPDGKSEAEEKLAAAVRCIDFNALDVGDQESFRHSLQVSMIHLESLNQWIHPFVVRAVGHVHIDSAWLSPWTETVEVVRNSFETALQLMSEYPDFVYTQSSPQHFEWVQEIYPDLFHQIQQRVQEGRWELVGSMWVEPDLNMPDGESLVRQILMGKRYYLKNFGVNVRVDWNVDGFGFSWQMPQIYKKSGVDYFVSQKLSGNDTTKFPHKLFWWQAPDGSKVLTYFPQGYGNDINPVDIANILATYVPSTGFSEIMHVYRVSEHGGDDARLNLDAILRLQNPKVPFPHICFSTVQSFFDDVDKGLEGGKLRLPVWDNELYLEFHRGVYTTQSETKKLIRQSEVLLQNAEKFTCWSFLGGQVYPHSLLLDCWKRLLFDQFHDIMPGSGIAVNYADAARNLEVVRLKGEKILREALEEIALHVNTSGPGVPVVIFNPLSWTRTEPVVVEAQLPNNIQGGIEVRDRSGLLLPHQIISCDTVVHRVKLRVLVVGVPAYGYKVIHIASVVKPRTAPTALKATKTELENECLKVRIDPRTGCVTSLFNKADGREIIAPGAHGNLLQAFVDRPKVYDAWNLDREYEQHGWDIKEAEEIKLVETGPVRAVLKVKKRFHNSIFVQDICLYSEVPRVDVNMQVEWREKHVMLKVAFPVSVQSRFAAYEIPYGTIERPTTRNTPEEEGKFEVPALRWGDLSDSDHGFSILNNSKYGYDTNGNIIRLTLLRSPTWPDPHADEGFHEFTYALYPHCGDWKKGSTMRRGYELNFPLLPITTYSHSGTWEAERSFIEITPANVILTVVKKAEDDEAVILRYYEFEGKQVDVRLVLAEKGRRAVEVNLMENEESELLLSAGGHELQIPTRAYEIKTVKVWIETNNCKMTL
jgi:alpha-mannosidase